jgi:hypothetical protein
MKQKIDLNGGIRLILTKAMSKYDFNRNIFKIILALIFLIAIFSSTRIISAAKPRPQDKEFLITKPFEPVEIDEGVIAKANPADYLDIRCYLEKDHKYHIFLVGDWVQNTTSATDYDIKVMYAPYGSMPISWHTESAGLPEQVANDVNQQYFVPIESGYYIFHIYNDPKDSGGADAAVFMIIERIQMNKRYSVELRGRPSESSPYPTDFNYAYEVATSVEDFQLFVEVPDPDPLQRYVGLDMFEARLYPMSNPSADVGYYITGIGVPRGSFLTGEHTDQYGGYNTTHEGFRFPQWTASCEYSGEDMLVTFGKPKHNATELILDDETVYYYLAFLAEYGYGTIQFYLKNDYRNPNVTIVESDKFGYTGERTLIQANVSGYHDIDEAWLYYTTNNWKTSESIQMEFKSDLWEAYLPKFSLNQNVKYRVKAIDEINNLDQTEANFTVKDKVEVDCGVSRTTMNGGETLNVVGACSLANVPLTLQFKSDRANENIKVTSDTMGKFEYQYKPPKVGDYTLTILYEGDDVNHPTQSILKEFTVLKRDLSVQCSLNMNPAKITKSLTVRGTLFPAISGVPIDLIFVTPTGSLIESVISSGDGSFSVSIVPEELGLWELLAQVKNTEYYNPSQGDIIRFEVIQLTIPETIMAKALEFTKPPLLYAPIGLFVLSLGAIEMKTGFIRSSIKKIRGVKKPEEEVEGEKEEKPTGVTSYKRRSSR